MKKEIKGGHITFRKPNCAEKLILFGELGITEKELRAIDEDAQQGKQSSKMMIFAGKLMNKFGEFVQEININIEGRIIHEYHELLKEDSYMQELTELSMSLLNNGVDEEKKPESES